MLNCLKHKAFFKTQSLHATLSSVMWIRFITKMYVIQLWASEMDFEVEGPWNTETMADKKKLWILDALAWLKKKHFDPEHSLLIVPALKLFCFLPLVLFSSIKSSLILANLSKADTIGAKKFVRFRQMSALQRVFLKLIHTINFCRKLHFYYFVYVNHPFLGQEQAVRNKSEYVLS